MADLVNQILASPIQLTDRLIKAADEAATFKLECSDLKLKAEKLAGLLRQAARAGNDLYDRPTRRIVEDTEKVLDKALLLVLKCRGHGIVKRVAFTLIPVTAFRKMSSQLDNSINDVSWLLRVSASRDDDVDGFLGLPPIAVNEPMLHLIWEQISLLYKGSPEYRAAAAASLVQLARDNDRNAKLIIEEGGIGPLLKLLKEGKLEEAQENAARAIGFLGRDPENVESMIHAGVCIVFAKILKESSMKVQAAVAWAVSELAAHFPKSQDLFAQHNIIRLLVSHLAFETVEEHSRYTVVGLGKATSMHSAVVLASSKINNQNVMKMGVDLDDYKSPVHHPMGKNKLSNHMQNGVPKSDGGSRDHADFGENKFHSQSLFTRKAREMEDPITKSYMKAMAARALWKLAKGNSQICRSITESRALLCFAALIEKGTREVRFNSAMALMEITAVAEEDPELRRSAFKPNSPACKAITDQIFSEIEKPDSDLLIPCIKIIGNISRTFKSTETRMISPLVNLLDEREADPEVSKEACIALRKFARTENYLHLDHSKAMLVCGAAKFLVQLVYFGGQIVQASALTLLCYIAMHVPESDDLGGAEVLSLLEWALKQSLLMQVEETEELVVEAKGKLEVFQSRGRGGR